MTHTITFSVEAGEAVSELQAFAAALDAVTEAADRLHLALNPVAATTEPLDAQDVVRRTELLIRSMVKQELGCA